MNSWLSFRKIEANLSPKHLAQLESRTKLILQILLKRKPERLASSVTQQDAEYLRTELPGRVSCQSRSQANTLSKYYTTFNLLMMYIAKQRYVDVAPRIEHHYKRPKTDVTQPLSDADLQLLFNGPIYADFQNGGNARWVAHAFKFWITPISLFTGMRLNEICQLEIRDIREKADGWIISVNDDSPTKSLKTENSRRELPIPQALLAMGFLEYVAQVNERQNKAKRARLFPELNYSTMHRHSREATRFFMGEGDKPGYLLQCCELDTEDNFGFKSLRRSFAQKLRNQGVAAEVIADLLGHASDADLNTVRSHYAGKSLTEVRRDVVERYVRYDVNLAQVHWSNYEQLYLKHRTNRKRGARKA
ncbi:Phage integrase family protein [compost metagenome]